MDGNTVSVLQQLVSNPQLVRQLKDVLSILAPQTASPNVTSSASDSTHITPVSDTLQDTVSASSASSPVLTLGRSTPSTTPALAPVPSASHNTQKSVSATTTTTSSTTPASVRLGGLTRKATTTTATATTQTSAATTRTTHSALEDELRAKREEIDQLHRERDVRAREWESETRRLSQQIDQLTHTVAEQRLQLAEMKHRYEAALLRKDELHEAAMRQMMQTHSDSATASLSSLAAPRLVSQTGLSENMAAINTRPSTTTTNIADSAVSRSPPPPTTTPGQTSYKRNRDGSADTMTKNERNGTISSTVAGRPSATKNVLTRDTVNNGYAESNNEYADGRNATAMNGNSEKPKRATRPAPLPAALTTRIQQQQQMQLGRKAAQKSVTPPAMMRGRRRTPRTPSLTNADRIIAANESASRSREATAITTPSPQAQTAYLTSYPASATTNTHAIASNMSSSLRLDSPTPVAVQSRLQPPRVMSQYNPITTLTTGTGEAIRPGTRSDTLSDSKTEAKARVANTTTNTTQQDKDVALKAQRFVEHYGGVAALGPKSNALTSYPATADGPGQRDVRRAKPRTANDEESNTNGAHTSTPVVQGTRSATSSAIGGGPTRSPSPLNPKRGPALPRRFIFTGLKDNEPERLREAIEQIGDDACALDGDLDEPPPFHTTHIVLRGTPRSVKALCGVVSGKWLVAPEYIYNSAQAGFWLDEFDEGGLRIFPPPLKCQRFVLTLEHEAIRSKLAQVIEYGGGEVVTSTATSRTRSSRGSGNASRPSLKQLNEQGIIVITSGDDLLRYATQQQA